MRIETEVRLRKDYDIVSTCPLCGAPIYVESLKGHGYGSTATIAPAFTCTCRYAFVPRVLHNSVVIMEKRG